MTLFFAALSFLSLLIWLYLIALRGRFWLADQQLEEDLEEPESWPAVVALVPARNEAEVIEHSLEGLLRQDYPGPFHVILIDDHSRDGTARLASALAEKLGRQERFTLARAGELPAGWSGKVWTLAAGWQEAQRIMPEARYLWLSDADIAHWLGNLRHLVTKAEAEQRDMVSLMAMLPCESFWERLLIPPFVFFFQKLYPFRWVANPRRRTAAAAGGCILVNAEALSQAGDFNAIRGELIDDCALARNVKAVARERGRRIWLGLGTECESLRPYEDLRPIWDMVARSAYTQLDHAPGKLAATLLGMVVTYLVPPLALVGGLIGGLFLDVSDIGAGLIIYLSGMGAWGLMALAAWPTNKLYDQPFWMGFALPAAAVLYMAMTLDSARRHRAGEGGRWKGRVQAVPATSASRGTRRGASGGVEEHGGDL
jgi:hopene-associated glycosyltransferase HpnB